MGMLMNPGRLPGSEKAGASLSCVAGWSVGQTKAYRGVRIQRVKVDACHSLRYPRSTRAEASVPHC
jgi:hypothetical protein